MTLCVADANQDMTAGGVRPSPPDGDQSQSSFPQGRRRNASQIQRKQTGAYITRVNRSGLVFGNFMVTLFLIITFFQLSFSEPR